MKRITWEDAERNPSADPTEFDWASFYVEELKYGVGEGVVEMADDEEMAAQFDALLERIGVTTMTGEELARALMYYGDSFTQLPVSRAVALSIFVDGVLHGMAFAGGVHGELRNEKS